MSGSAQPTTAQPAARIAQAARLRHIEALARRAQQHDGPARRLMEARLQQLRDAWAAEPTQGFSRGAENVPDKTTGSAEEPVERAVWGAAAAGAEVPAVGLLRRNHPRADSSVGPHAGPNTLAQLLAHINSATAPTAGTEPKPAPAAEPGRAPDAATKTRLATNTAPTRATSRGTTPPASAPELKAISQYRSTWSRLTAEQRLHQALAQVPSNAGPLNTQRLLHQALEAMRDASPDYLHRFMVQVETLLWLEQLGPGTAPVADKKPAARKARA